MPPKAPVAAPPASGAFPLANETYPWDEFDPELYVRKNYCELRDDDRRILQLVGDFFADCGTGPGMAKGLDLGSGANLYPALAMLPFCRDVTLYERGAKNCTWLKQQVRGYSPFWNDYWDLLTRDPYLTLGNPRAAFRERARVHWGDLYRLPRRRRWGLGTMFFVAESISDQEREFKLAVERFMGALKQGAPFAAAFMDRSEGYWVGRLKFPAVAVNEVDVKHCLAPLADDLDIKNIPTNAPLRDGHKGMILALGRVAKARN